VIVEVALELRALARPQGFIGDSPVQSDVDDVAVRVVESAVHNEEIEGALRLVLHLAGDDERAVADRVVRRGHGQLHFSGGILTYPQRQLIVGDVFSRDVAQRIRVDGDPEAALLPRRDHRPVQVGAKVAFDRIAVGIEQCHRYGHLSVHHLIRDVDHLAHDVDAALFGHPGRVADELEHVFGFGPRPFDRSARSEASGVAPATDVPHNRLPGRQAFSGSTEATSKHTCQNHRNQSHDPSAAHLIRSLGETSHPTREAPCPGETITAWAAVRDRLLC